MGNSVASACESCVDTVRGGNVKYGVGLKFVRDHKAGALRVVGVYGGSVFSPSAGSIALGRRMIGIPDTLVAIDGVDVHGTSDESLQETARLLLGPSGTPVELSLQYALETDGLRPIYIVVLHRSTPVSVPQNGISEIGYNPLEL